MHVWDFVHGIKARDPTLTRDSPSMAAVHIFQHQVFRRKENLHAILAGSFHNPATLLAAGLVQAC